MSTRFFYYSFSHLLNKITIICGPIDACLTFQTRIISNTKHTSSQRYIHQSISYPPLISIKDFLPKRLIWQITQPTNQSFSLVYQAPSRLPDPVVRYHPTKSFRTLLKKRQELMKSSFIVSMMVL